LEVISKSKAVIDIEHPDQKGLTMRTMEMLGTPENICIIDRKNPEVPQDFFENEYKVLPVEIY